MIADAIGLEIQPTGRVSDQPVSTVLEQHPDPGATVAHGSVVDIVVATAAEQVVVPDLLGVPEPEALRLLSGAGLVPGARTETPAPLIDSGAIASQDPPAGTRVPRGTPVSYSISTAAIAPSEGASISPTPLVATPVPPVNGLRVGDYRCMVLPEARTHIRDDGFKVGRISYSIEGGPVDDTWAVVRQDPAPKSRLARGGAIDILMASPFGICARPGR
jgi:beta-lactam-binding protein with PASTA domain